MALKSISTVRLRQELVRRERGAQRLAAKRAKLAKQLAALDAELGSLGVGAAPVAATRGRRAARKTRRRAKNAISLPDAICKVIKVGAVITPAKAAAAARSTGYKSSSSNFGMLVSNALGKDKRFKRQARGQYKRVS